MDLSKEGIGTVEDSGRKVVYCIGDDETVVVMGMGVVLEVQAKTTRALYGI